MAEVNIEVKADIADVEKSVALLTRELRDAKLELQGLDKNTDAYAKKKQSIDSLTKSLNQQKDTLQDLKLEAKYSSDNFSELKEKMDGIRDESLTQVGSGVERVTNSFGLMREGFENFDTDKIKVGFQGIGRAMAAIPLLLLVEGVALLIENFDEVIKFMKEFFNLASDGEKKIEKLNKEIENSKKNTELLTTALDNQIKILEAQGASEDKILKIKKEASQLRVKELEQTLELNKAKLVEALSNDSITESLLRKQAAVLRGLGQDKAADAIEQAIQKDKLERNKELIDAIKDSVKNISTEKTNQAIEEIKLEKTKTDNLKKALEERNKARQEQANSDRDLSDRLTDEELAVQEAKQKQLEANEAFLEEYYKRENARIDAAAKKKDEDAQKEKDRLKAIMAAYQEAAYSQIQIAKGIADTISILNENKFTEEKNRITKALQNDKLDANQRYTLELELYNKEVELKKKKFQVDKAFQVAQAIQDGIRSVTGALAQTATLGPGAIALAATNAGIAAANVAKILATKFDAGVAPAPPSLDISGGSTPSSNTQPSLQQLPGQEGTVIKEKPQNIYVSVREINDVSGQVARVQQQRKF